MDKRSKRVVVVAHCILNASAKYPGGADYPGANTAFLEPYLREGVGIVQLPCPESSFLGMLRWGMTRDQYDTPAYRRHCARILEPTLDTLESFRSAGYEIVGAFGVTGSPSCGVRTTCEGFTGGDPAEQPAHKVAGSGVFFEVLAAELERRGLGDIPLDEVSDPK